jgi:hypothetical protein
MAEFAAEVRRLMAEHGMKLRGLAKASNYDASYLSKVPSAQAVISVPAARLDDALGAGGTIRDAAQQPPPRRESRASAPGRKPSGAVEALQVAMTGDPAGPDIGADGLAELVLHYAHALAVAPSTAVYGELLSARSLAGTLLGRSAPRQRPDLTVSGLTGCPACRDPAADSATTRPRSSGADTERRGRDASYPELLGWAALTRSLIAWYQGNPLASAAAARRGQAAWAARLGRARQARRPGDALPGHARPTPPMDRRPAPGRRRDGAARPADPGRQRVLGPAGRGPAVHRDLAAAGGQIRRGGADDAADHRGGLPPAGASTVGPADQLCPNAPDPRPRRRRAR